MPIIEPRLGDPDRAEDMLDEVQAVLAKRKMMLIHRPNCIVLAVENPAEGNWRAIAQVQVIEPHQITWRPVDWKPRTVQ